MSVLAVRYTVETPSGFVAVSETGVCFLTGDASAAMSFDSDDAAIEFAEPRIDSAYWVHELSEAGVCVVHIFPEKE